MQQQSESPIFNKDVNSRFQPIPPLFSLLSKAETLIFSFFRIMATLNIIHPIQPSFISNSKHHSNENKVKSLHEVPALPSTQRLSSFQQRILKGMILYWIISSLSSNFAVFASSPTSKEISLKSSEDDNSSLTQVNLENPPSFPSTSDIRTLEIGKVLKSLRLNTDSIILSHDSKLAFVILKFSGALRVIDISDNQNPITIGSLENLKRLEFYASYRFKRLALSADGKTLFASSIEYLEIIDVSDPQIPSFKGILQDPKFSDITGRDIPEYCIPTVALSSDEKIFYVAGNGLQIINVTNISRSEILYSARMPGRKTSLALFPDSKTLLYANETLDFYDVSDPTKPQLKRSYTSENISISSVFLSKNAKKAYTTGRASTTNFVMLQEIDISQPDSPKYLSRYELGASEYVPPSIITLSPSETNLFLIKQLKPIPKYPLPIGVYPPIEVFGIDLLKKQFMVQSKNFFAKATTFLMIPGSQNVVTNSNDQLQIIQLFKDYPNTKTFCLANNSRGNSAFSSPVSFVEPSIDGNTLFTLDDDHNFESFNFIDKNSPPKSLGGLMLPVQKNFEVQKLVITKNFALLQGEGSIYGVNISDPSKISFLGLITRNPLMGAFVFSLKEALLFTFTVTKPDNFAITTTMVDFSDISSIKEKNILTFPSYQLQNLACLSRNGNLLFVFAQKFNIYNVSNPLSPTLLSSKAFPIFKDKILLPMTLSANEKTLFILNLDLNNYANLAILDVSDTENVNLVSTLELPKITQSPFFNPFVISRDMKRGFLVTEQNLLVIDFKNLTAPVIIGMIPLGILSEEKVSSFFLSPDEKIGYLADNEGHFLQLNLEMPFTLFLSQEKFLLGKKYSDSLMFLSSQNILSDFLLMEPSSEYQINKILLYDFQVLSTETSPVVSYSSLPPWIHFDHENQVLSVECKDQSDLGSYTLYSLASRKIPLDVFDDMFHGSIISEDMITLLITLGYMDNQLFLTSSFGSPENFLLPSQYWDYEEIIHQTLLSYRIETFTDFEILPSLKLSTNSAGNFLITSPSNYAIKVGIKLHNSQVKFLQKIYGTLQPVITEQKSRLTIEGPLDLINEALKDLVIDQNNNDTNSSFSGEITINDKINPSISQAYQNISSYFSKNDAPVLNSSHPFTLQQQIDQNIFYTGQSFSIQIDPRTFMDSHSEILSYELIQSSSNKEGNLPPSWLTFQDGLNLKGTPPEDFLHREVHLVLIVKNEFKQITVPFTLNIQISLLFAGKLLIRYSPYILGLVGLMVSANKIYSILMKKKSRHEKNFYVTVGEEITSNMVFPIKFIKEEKAEGEMILRKLSLSENFDEIQIKEEIKERVDSMNKQEKQRLKIYFQEGDIGRNRVEQYILNELIMRQLDSKQEKPTKKLFDTVKEDWTEFIEYEDGSFKINEIELDCLLERAQEEKNPLGETLLQEINFDLLKKALVVYAAKKHELDYLERTVDIQIKMKTERNFLWKFLKRDLERIPYSERSRMVYGINYRIQGSMLSVSGIPDADFDGKILVFQIISQHQRILKELWIHGNPAKNENKKRASYAIAPQMTDESYNVI